jgi:hypothetical protein
VCVCEGGGGGAAQCSPASPAYVIIWCSCIFNLFLLTSIFPVLLKLYSVLSRDFILVVLAFLNIYIYIYIYLLLFVLMYSFAPFDITHPEKACAVQC